MAWPRVVGTEVGKSHGGCILKVEATVLPVGRAVEATGDQRSPGQFWGLWSSNREAGGTIFHPGGVGGRSRSGGQKLCLAQSVLS